MEERRHTLEALLQVGHADVQPSCGKPNRARPSPAQRQAVQQSVGPDHLATPVCAATQHAGRALSTC